MTGTTQVLRNKLMLHTVPLDRTGTQPRPRQARAMVSSCLLSPLLLPLFVFLCRSFLSPADCLSSVSQYSHLQTFSETFLCKPDIQTSNIGRHRPSPTTSSPTHLLSLLSPPFSWPNTSLKTHISPSSVSHVDTMTSLKDPLHSLRMMRHFITNSKHFSVLSLMSHPRPLVSDGRILPGHGLSPVPDRNLFVMQLYVEGGGLAATKY